MGNDCGSTRNLEMTEGVGEDDELMEDQIGLDNEESCTADKVRWKKKKKVRRRMMFE